MAILSSGHKLSIDIGNYCNLNCPSCFRVAQTDAYNRKNNTKLKNHPFLNTIHVTLDDAKQWFPEKFLRERISHVEFCGASSEPSLNPFCIELIEYFSKHVDIVSMSTNGDTKTTEWWQRLAKSAPNFVVRFYPDSLKENNSLYRQSNTDRVLQNMKAFISAGGKSILTHVIFKHNQDEIDQFKNIAKELNCSYRMYVAREFTDGKTTSYEATHNGKKYILEQNNIISSNPPFKEVRSSDVNSYCTLTYEKIIRVFCNGVIFPCCHTEGELFEVYEQFFLNENNTKPNVDIHPQINKDIVSKIEIQGGIKSICLKYNSIENILNGSFYRNSLQTSWKLKTNETCCNTCINGSKSFIEEENIYNLNLTNRQE